MEPVSLPRQRAEVLVNDFVKSVYQWMCIGLGLTGFIAYYVSGNEALITMLRSNPLLLILLIVAQFGLVIAISGMVNRMSAATATALFVVYSALTGVTLSFVFLIYTRASIVSTFFICSATFLACSIYGWTTKKDLTSLGGFLIMGLFGIIIASVVNWFMASSALYYAIGYIGVFIFVGLTAYDTQKLKNMALTQPEGIGSSAVRKAAILGALSLYLDFINLFLMLLRIFGHSRN